MTDDETPRKKKSTKRPKTGDLATLLRTHEPLRARMIAELLETEGIHAATPGLEHRSMVGPFAGYVDVSILVPEEDLERAKAIVDALDAAEPAIDPTEEPGTYRSGQRKEASSDASLVRLRRIAVVTAFVIPGGGHMYARRYARGYTILALQLLLLFAASHDVPLASLLLLVPFVADLVGAFRICDITQGKLPPESERGWIVPVTAVSVLGGLFALSGPVARAIAGPGDVGVCEWTARCREGNATECVLGSARARTTGEAPAVSDRCGACLGTVACDAVADCADACQELRLGQDEYEDEE